MSIENGKVEVALVAWRGDDVVGEVIGEFRSRGMGIEVKVDLECLAKEHGLAVEYRVVAIERLLHGA